MVEVFVESVVGCPRHAVVDRVIVVNDDCLVYFLKDGIEIAVRQGFIEHRKAYI